MVWKKRKHSCKKLIMLLAVIAVIAGCLVPAQTASAATSKTQRAKIIWDYLIDQGFTEEAAAGILGNMDLESNLNPKAGKSCYGLIQWSGSRKTKLYRYAKKQGKSAGNIKVQLKYLVKKDCTGIKSYMKKHDSTVKEATIAFETKYECAGRPNMSKRVSRAKYWYKKFKS